MMDGEIPDYTDEVQYIDRQPIFWGKYSHVYKGTLRGETVAIKMIQPVTKSLHSMKRKFRRESEVWGRLRHQNIVPLYGFAMNITLFGPFGALISPWYEHGDAGRFLKEKGHTLTIEQRKSLWREVVAGVCYLHSQSPPVIHGDLKPGNILIDDQGVARICDFGQARIFMEEGDHSGMTTTSLHRGTERYLPHELVTSDDANQLTKASDVYSMGCVGLFIPYADRENNKFGDISRDIRDGIPPATKPSVVSTEEARLWFTLERCWGTLPNKRTSAPWVLEALQDNTTPPTAEYDIEFPSFLPRTSLPRELLVEGSDWYALYNPRVPKALLVDVMHEIDPEDIVLSMRISRDGVYLATGGKGMAQIFDTNTGGVVARFGIYGEAPNIYCIAFSPDGKCLATGSGNGQIKIWDITEKQIRQEFRQPQCHNEEICSMIFSSTGSFIVSRVRDGTVRIWSLDGKPTRVLKTVPIDNVIQFTDSVESLAISPDDGLLVGGTREGTIYLWEVYTGRLLGRFPGHDNVVYSVTFAPDGRGFLSGSWDNTIKYHKIDFDTLHEITDSTSLVRAAEGENDLVKCECTLTSHTNSIVDVSISPDGQWIVSASLDGTVMIWDSNGTPHLMLRDHKYTVSSTNFSPSGKLFATTNGQRIKIWNFSTI